jgi:uncharacterized membrane protein
MATIPAGAPDVRIGDWLKEGWEVFVADVGMFLLASLIYNVIMVTCLGGLILFGPLTCGFYLMIFERMKGGKADMKQFFGGFNFFGNAFLAGFIFFLLSLVGVIITCVGAMLCMVPSLIGIALLVLLQTAFLFTFQLIAQKRIGAGEAISMSFNKVKENLGQFLLFALLLWIINAAGYSVMLGWLVTTPLTLAASGAAYRSVFGLEGSGMEQQPVQV